MSRSDATRPPPKTAIFLKGLRRPSVPFSIPESIVAESPKLYGESSSATSPLHTPPLIPLDVNRPTRSVFVDLRANEPNSADLEGFSEHSEDSPDLEASPRDAGGMKRASVAEHASFQMRQALASSSSTPNPRRLSPRALNRRTSTLMMLCRSTPFPVNCEARPLTSLSTDPLAYLLLFSVAVGRLAVSLATNRPVHPVLTDIARCVRVFKSFALHF